MQPQDGTIERVPDERIPPVFQEDSVFARMTVLESVVFGLKMRRVDRKEREARARQLLARSGLAGRENAYPYRLSLGMKQRVAVMRCFSSDPAVMPMDEPFAALDAQTRPALQEELLALWEQDHKTVIIVTHDIEEAIPVSDRIFVLNGPPAEIVDEFQAPFGRPRDPSLALGEDSLDLKRRIRSKLGRGVLIPEGSLK